MWSRCVVSHIKLVHVDTLKLVFWVTLHNRNNRSRWTKWIIFSMHLSYYLYMGPLSTNIVRLTSADSIGVPNGQGRDKRCDSLDPHTYVVYLLYRIELHCVSRQCEQPDFRTFGRRWIFVSWFPTTGGRSELNDRFSKDECVAPQDADI